LLDIWPKIRRGSRFFIATTAKEELELSSAVFSYIWEFLDRPRVLWSSMAKEGLKEKIMESPNLAKYPISDISKITSKNRNISLRFYQ